MQETGFEVPLQQRGLKWDADKGLYLFAQAEGNKWVTPTGEKIADTDGMVTYTFYDRESTKTDAVKNKLIGQLNAKDPFYVDFLTFLTAVRSIMSKKEDVHDTLSKEAGNIASKHKKGDELVVVYPDQRLVQEGFQDYNDAKAAYGAESARHVAAYNALEKMCHGAMGEREINTSGTQRQYLETLAREAKLLPRKADGTHGV